IANDRAGTAPNITPGGAPQPQSAAPLRPPGDHSSGFTIHVRQRIVGLITPNGIILLFLLSFFPWRHAEPLARAGEATMLIVLDPSLTFNLWGLAFGGSGFSAFLVYVLLL